MGISDTTWKTKKVPGETLPTMETMAFYSELCCTIPSLYAYDSVLIALLSVCGQFGNPDESVNGGAVDITEQNFVDAAEKAVAEGSEESSSEHSVLSD